MLNKATVTAWLEAYVHAWKTYDQIAIGDLFSEDATYHYDPYSTPVHGRAAIVTSWLENQDAPNTYDGHYEPIMIEGNRAIANGRSRYFDLGSTTTRTEFDNIFILSFDDTGRCTEYSEWLMKRP